ncbi:MAG: FKBP-type peptidyl-prolyl cis-trans isomerase [Phycisphaerales bacterium]|nr:FKBP-type peptidyl-prolyl cis-trans isomerase [Phycisphaerales bacterium]
MRSPLAMLAIVGLASTVVVASLVQPAGQPGTPPPPVALPPAPPAPTPIPVPDGPVVATHELADGLLAEDIKVGEGDEVKSEHAFIVAHYHGTLKSDPTKIFDSSFNRGVPYPTSLQRVVAGWTKGFQGMKVGGIRRLTIPSALGYGAAGNGPDIPGGADLVFVVELVDMLQVTDDKVGSGEEATGQFLPVTVHTIKDDKGTVVASGEASAPYIWLPGEMNPPGTQFDSIQEAIKGMKVGGKRTVHIPGAMNGAPPQAQSKIPPGVPLTMEVELVALRVLTPAPQQRR